MSYSVEYESEALADLEKLDPEIRKRIVNKIEWFAQNFEQITPQSLTGDWTGFYQLREGKIMTIKEQLIHEIETVSDEVIEEVFDFLLLAKIKHHRSQEQSKPFARFIEELTADIPQEVLDTLPTDSAEQHDHYIYGTPKH